MRLIWMQLRVYPPEYVQRAVASLVMGSSLAREACAPASIGVLDMELAERTVRVNFERDVNLLSPVIAVTGFVLCKLDQGDGKAFVRLNQTLLGATILSAVLLARFATSSWMLSLIVAAMLFSRGMLLADLGAITSSYVMMFLLMFTATCFSHFFRTGSRATAILGVASMALLSLVDRALWMLAVVPLGLLFSGWLLTRDLFAHRIRQAAQRVQASSLSTLKNQSEQVDFGSQFARLAGTFRWFFGMEFEPKDEARSLRSKDERASGLFRVLPVDFLEWIFSQQRWLKLSAAVVALFFAAFLFDFGFSRALTGWSASGYITHLFPISELVNVLSAQFPTIFWRQMERVDMHFIVSFFVLILCAVQHPKAGLRGFFELAVFVSFLIVVVVVASVFTDVAEYRWAMDHYRLKYQQPLGNIYGIRNWLQWLEPLILTMGVVGFYNLMKVLDTRFTGKSS